MAYNRRSQCVDEDVDEHDDDDHPIVKCVNNVIFLHLIFETSVKKETPTQSHQRFIMTHLIISHVYLGCSLATVLIPFRDGKLRTKYVRI